VRFLGLPLPTQRAGKSLSGRYRSCIDGQRGPTAPFLAPGMDVPLRGPGAQRLIAAWPCGTLGSPIGAP
jgi:hypothetical protein